MNKNNMWRFGLNLISILFIVTILSACGGGSGANTSSNMPQSKWSVISTKDTGFSGYGDLKYITSSQNMESNFIFGAWNTGGFLYFENEVDKRWYSPYHAQDFKQLSCYKHACFGFYSYISNYGHIYIYDRIAKFMGNWYTINPQILQSESCSAMYATSERSFYIATNSKKIYSCNTTRQTRREDTYVWYTTDCNDITSNYTGSPINNIVANDDVIKPSLFLLTSEGIWQYNSTNSSWVLMPLSPTNGTDIRMDSMGRLFVSSSNGGFYYNGNMWQQILTNPQSSVTLCDVGDYAKNEKVFFSDATNINTNVNVFYPNSNVYDSISADIINPDTGTKFNTGIYNLITANNCYIYGLTKNNDRVYVITLK